VGNLIAPIVYKLAANLQSFAAIPLAYKINNVYLGVPASRGVSLIQMNPKFL